MRIVIRIWILAILIVVKADLIAAQEMDQTVRERIDSHMTEVMADLDIPGAAIAVVQQDEVVYLQAYGTAGADRPMTVQTPFLLASLSKSFTALAVMQLVEAEDLNLDNPVADYLDWFPYDSITLRHLLHHTSGFTEIAGTSYFTNGLSGPDALETTVRDVVAAYPPVAEPGERNEYSNMNYDLLGLIVQTVSGQPYGDYVQEHIFTPLEMVHSHTSLEAAQADGLSTGYTPFFTSPQAMEIVYSGGQVASGGLFSTAEDMSHYLIAQLNGGRYGEENVLSPEGITTLHTPGYSEGLFWGYAMGWQRFPLWQAIQPQGLYSTTMPYRIYHEGSYHNFRAFQELLPDTGWAALVLMNANNNAHESLYWNTVFGILQILSGVNELESVSASEDWLTQNYRWIGVLLVSLWIVMALWALRRLGQWWRDPARRPRHPLRIAGAILIPALLDVGMLYFILMIAPDVAAAPLSTVMAFAPDLRLQIYVLLFLIGVWGLVRTLMYIWLLVLHGTPGQKPSGAMA